MARIVDNRLLVNTILGVVLYWVFGFITPLPYVSSFASLVLILSSGVLAHRYWETTYAIVMRGARGKEAEDQGSHLAVYGAWLMAVGALYTGIFGLWWVIAGQPPTWTGTATSGFGRAIMAAGFVLMFWSPDAMQGQTRSPNALVLLVLFMISVAGAFVAGANLNVPDNVNLAHYFQLHGSDKPICPSDRPVWGSSRGLFHDENSQYRDMVIPTRCFMNEAEAIAAGFRKAN